MISSVVFFLRQSQIAQRTAIYRACLRLLDPILVIRFFVAENLPDSKRIYSGKCYKLSWVIKSIYISNLRDNRTAILSPIPGIDMMILYSSISLVRASISYSNFDRTVFSKGLRVAAALRFIAFSFAHLIDRL
jgi:hypothetical protein